VLQGRRHLTGWLRVEQKLKLKMALADEKLKEMAIAEKAAAAKRAQSVRLASFALPFARA
jgi:hypothetical protein